MSKSRIILVTGATVKVGRIFISRFLAEPKYDSFMVRASIHNRKLEPHARIQYIQGSIEQRDVVEKAMDGVTHVLHLATCKETPDQIISTPISTNFFCSGQMLAEWNFEDMARQFRIRGHIQHHLF